MAHTTSPPAFGHAQDCGCCGPASAVRGPRNRPGLTTLSHRAGTYGSFLTGMLEALSAQPGLRSLTTRDTDDPLVALLEAWASVGEVLATQHERFADEGFLGTAHTREAVQLHARALGYELRPGVAAATDLVLGLDLPPDGPDELLLAPGVAVQSVPPDGDQPQVFETVEELVAHRGLDDLRPVRVEDVRPGTAGALVVLDGTVTGLSAGDLLLLVAPDGSTVPADERWTTARVASVEAVEADPLDPAITAHTLVHLQAAVTGLPAVGDVEVHVLRQSVPMFGHAAPPWPQLPAALRVGERDPAVPDDPVQLLPGAYAGRADTWVEAALDAATTELELARRVDDAVAGSWAVVTAEGDAMLVAVTGVTERALADFVLTAEATVLTVEGDGFERFSRRSGTVWCASEQLALGRRRLVEPVDGQWLQLEREAAAITPGRRVVLEGREDLGEGVSPGEPVVHATTVLFACPATGPGGAAVTQLVLADGPPVPLARQTVHVHANVAAATHGVTRAIVLGSGDASRAHQAFTLPEGDLTFVPVDLAVAPTPLDRTRGAASTLEVRVDGLPWEQVPTLHGLAPDAHVYTARARSSDGRVVVRFGDGVQGARLPSGVDNVTATYRVGVGLAGQVGAESLTVLQSRPLGLTSVRNPSAATGAADPEALEDARTNAPTGVRTLDRLVSLADVTDLARAHAQVGDARAAWVWRADERVVHVTIVPPDRRVLPPDDPLLATVAEALEGARHPGAPLVVAPHVPVTVTVVAGLTIDPDRDAAAVLAAAHDAVLDALRVEVRPLARSLAGSEVLAVLHAVEGVVAVDLDAFHPTAGAAGLQPSVPGRPARVVQGQLVAAELVGVDVVTLTEVTT